jgi:hypothetical protein
MAMDSENRRGPESPQSETESNRDTARCDACGAEMKPMGHCKYWCLQCGFLRTCNDVI